MKKGPVILLVVGLAISAGLYFAPVKPSNENATEVSTNEQFSDNHNHEGHDHAAESNQQGGPPVDAQIDDILAKMRNQEMPPMQAVLAIRAIADEHPDNVKANFTLGLMSIQTAQFEKAVQRFDAVLQVDAQNAEAMRLRAQSYLGMGDTAAAIANYEQALENAPNEELKASVNEALTQIKSNN